MTQDFYETPEGQQHLEAYERGYRAGITQALEDPEEARSYLAEAASYLAWKKESHELPPTPPLDDDTPF